MSSNSSSSANEEHPTTQCTANLKHIFRREIIYENLPRHIQLMILEASAIESKLVELFEKPKDSDSTQAPGLSREYLHLFKEYSCIVHKIDGALRDMTNHSVSPEMLIRWAVLIYKTTESMIRALQLLAVVHVDEERPDRTRRDIDDACKAIFMAYEPIDRVEEEITYYCPLEAEELASVAQNTDIIFRAARPPSPSTSDGSGDEGYFLSDSDDTDDTDFPRDNNGYINLDEYECRTEGGRIYLERKEKVSEPGAHTD
ncbi:uncharacterized protein GGS22DRAFT_190482 [Annulohypoxylon maeteangense]|uniref:uncharacterized protein n=1 Tax=Annulohypoxylon maeteangense TaxID=1927788 RepID=UPI002008E747|nr:uncharacterized protein GGS22DRAFT_190482 [Annulohypoxylon maeteangense]KAI0883169.1 hypothetical protein GGS22DRAFT_190482 [Annulohypoxylon maeteangense]